MEATINTGAELYKEMKFRGLHLRNKNGRDNNLYEQLKKRLKCSENNIQTFLDKSSLTAEAFLIEFLTITEPFAQMFQEIWEYLATNEGVKANESLLVNFGFPQDIERVNIDLEKFRLYAELSEKVLSIVTTSLWSSEAMHKLFNLSEILYNELNEKTQDYGRYQPGERFILPVVDPQTHPVDFIVAEIRNVFQKIISDYFREKQKRLDRDLSMFNIIDPISDQALGENAYLLLDLLPRWLVIFSNINEISEIRKNEGYTYYKEEIEPYLTTEEEEKEVNLLEALDILNLPFWKHRWHTYEVWSTITILKTLQDYSPKLRITNGRIPIDGYEEEIIADLNTSLFPLACIVSQSTTPYKTGKRTAIKPDIRICFDDLNNLNSTAAIVEFKQQNNMNQKYIEEIAESYTLGSPRTGGTIIINYDDCRITPNLVSKSILIPSVNPGEIYKVSEFQNELLRILRFVNFDRAKDDKIVLLDVSESMENLYEDSEFKKGFDSLKSNKTVEIYLFNDGLVEGGNMKQQTISNRYISGGTQLERALIELENIVGSIEHILIVTDGGHENPTKLKQIPKLKQCFPNELPRFIPWLLGS